jgi:hypothetical protein
MLNNNNYEKDGVKHYTYVVGVQNVSFGEGKGNSEDGQQGYTTSDSKATTLDDVDLSEFEELGDGDVPF